MIVIVVVQIRHCISALYIKEIQKANYFNINSLLHYTQSAIFHLSAISKQLASQAAPYSQRTKYRLIDARCAWTSLHE